LVIEKFKWRFVPISEKVSAAEIGFGSDGNAPNIKFAQPRESTRQEVCHLGMPPA
jgi:hypothetical protein